MDTFRSGVSKKGQPWCEPHHARPLPFAAATMPPALALCQWPSEPREDSLQRDCSSHRAVAPVGLGLSTVMCPAQRFSWDRLESQKEVHETLPEILGKLQDPRKLMQWSPKPAPSERFENCSCEVSHRFLRCSLSTCGRALNVPLKEALATCRACAAGLVDEGGL